jgi:uncharacterized protein (DUF2237 family)
MARYLLGEELMPCSIEPLTGFFRDACCNTGPEDLGRHVVCAEMTADFLEFSQAVGNDLSTPMPMYGFPGLNPGDRWCVCAARWQQAHDAGVVAPVILASTHEAALEVCDEAALRAAAVQ